MKGLSVYVVVAWLVYIAAVKYVADTWSEQNHPVVIVVLTTATLMVITITELYRVERQRYASQRQQPGKQDTEYHSS